MKILVCDRCGTRKEVSQIVGTEFDRHGFETLHPTYRRSGVTDVCGPCYKHIVKLHKERLNSALDIIKAFVDTKDG